MTTSVGNRSPITWHCLDRRTVQNVATQVPYANVRVLETGWGRARPDDSQLRRIRYQIRRGMEEGGTGLSTGLDYIAQCFAETDELAEAIAATAPYGGVYVTHRSLQAWHACRRARSGRIGSPREGGRAHLASERDQPARG